LYHIWTDNSFCKCTPYYLVAIHKWWRNQLKKARNSTPNGPTVCCH